MIIRRPEDGKKGTKEVESAKFAVSREDKTRRNGGVAATDFGVDTQIHLM